MCRHEDKPHDHVGLHAEASGERLYDPRQTDANIIDRISLFVDKHLRVIRYTSYIIAGVGFVSITRSLRLFSKFNALGQIPDRFIRKHVTLRGTVKDIQGSLLLVDHTPIYQMPFSKWLNSSACAATPKLLPVSIGGTTLHPSGRKWLEEKVQDKSIRFKLLTVSRSELNTDIPNSDISSHKNYDQNAAEINKAGIADVEQNVSISPVKAQRMATSATYLESINTETANKEVIHCIVWSRKNFFSSICLNEYLIREGHAKVCHIENMPNDKLYIKFSEKLLKMEINAERKGMGLWKRPSLNERCKDYVGSKISSSKDFARNIRNKMSFKDRARNLKNKMSIITWARNIKSKMNIKNWFRKS